MVFPKAVQAATLFLSPQSGSFNVGSTFNVALNVNTTGTAINAAQATVRFPTATLEVTSLTKGNIFTLWTVEPSYSNSAGTITFSGGLPSPGFNGSAGRILTITFRAKSAGTPTVSITDGRVLANDGQGTNVLTSQGTGTYTLAVAPTLNLPAAPSISSSTHPDQNLWYTRTDAAFAWTAEDGVTGYSYSLDDQETATPDTIQDGTDLAATYSGIADGTWYFHVRARNADGWGEASHFRIRIDTSSPAAFSIFALLESSSDPNIQRQISFETTDTPSGIHHYELSIDQGAVIPIDVGATTPYTLPTLTEGEHTLVVYAVDFAGNRTLASATITIGTRSGVTPPPETEPEPETVPTPIAAIIPEPILDFADRIFEPIERLRANEEISQVTDDVLEPVSTTVAVLTAVGLATSTTAIELTNVLYLFFRFGYFWLVPISIGKKRKPWGVVFDSTTGRQIKNAVVRIFAAEFNKLKESQLTDAQGRFGFLVDVGEYYITVTHPGYMYPSRLLQTAMISQYENIYRGEKFEVKERVEGSLHINVPLDPDVGLVSAGRIRWLRVLNFIGLILEKMNVPLLVGGTLISWVTLVFYPKPVNYWILGLYALLIALKVILLKRHRHSWGIVRNALDKSAVDLAVVRIYDMANGRVVATRITNSEGKFSALVPPGRYYVIVTRAGYVAYQSPPMVVKRKRALIRLSILLNPQAAAFPQTPPQTPPTVVPPAEQTRA